MVTDSKQRDRSNRKKRKNKPQTTRVTFHGVTFNVTDDEDPDTVIEAYVAAGKHEQLEESDPDTVLMLTKRYVKHQQWLEGEHDKKGRRKNG